MDSSQMNGKPEADNSTDPDTPHTPVMESMNRLVKIPVVEKTLHAATDVYEKVKESSSTLSRTLSTVESTVNKAVESAMPLTAKLEKPLKTVDSLLCSSLDYVESKVPAVKLPPQEILDTTKTLVQEKAAAVKEYGGRKLSVVRSMSLDRQSAAMLAQNCKELATTGMEKARDVAHRLISPKEEEEIEEVFFFSFFFAAWVQQSPRKGSRHSSSRIHYQERARLSLLPCNTMAMATNQRPPMLCGTNFDFLHLSIAMPPFLTSFLAPFRRKLPAPSAPLKIRELELIEELDE